jgi:hypothetical protein
MMIRKLAVAEALFRSLVRLLVTIELGNGASLLFRESPQAQGILGLRSRELTAVRRRFHGGGRKKNRNNPMQSQTAIPAELPFNGQGEPAQLAKTSKQSAERSRQCARVGASSTGHGKNEVSGHRRPDASARGHTSGEKTGAGEGARTLDPDLGKVVLYH